MLTASEAILEFHFYHKISRNVNKGVTSLNFHLEKDHNEETESEEQDHGQGNKR